MAGTYKIMIADDFPILREDLAEVIREQPDMELFDIYIDDGYSGANFDRPDFKRMMADIENGNYKDAVQKLIAANRLNPKLREVYSSLNTACTHTNQISLLKEFLVKGKGIFEEDDELCYYLGNIYQNQQNYTAAIKEYSLAIQYAKKNGEEYELVYAYYLNRGNCYLKQREFAKAIPDYTYSLKLNKDNGAIYANRGIAYFSTGKRKEACADWRKAKSLGVTSVNAYINRYCR